MSSILSQLMNQVRDIITDDPAHDFDHVLRVYYNALKICNIERVDPLLVCCAALLHDIVFYPKSDERSKLSALHSSNLAEIILKDYDLSRTQIDIICNAIREHSYSSHIKAKTIQSQILQDADRLDALGAIGIARAFATGASLKRQFYNIVDPLCTYRIPDDHKWTLDHFYSKLLDLESSMNTDSAKIEARRRTEFLKAYLEQLGREIQP